MHSTHVESLKAKHAGIEARLHDELARPAPDDTTIRRLKREKLRIKEAIAAH